MPLRQGGATFVLLVPVAFVVYLASWTGWLVTDGGYDRHAADANPATGFWSWVPLPLQSLWNDHVTMYNAASQITSATTRTRVPRGSGRCCCVRPGCTTTRTPSARTAAQPSNGCSQVIASIPNPLIWYAGVAAVLYLVYRFVVARDWRYALVLTGVAVTYVPWLFFPERTIFQFYTVLILPFMLLALTFALRDIAGPRHADSYRRLTGQRLVWVFLGVAVAAVGVLVPGDLGDDGAVRLLAPAQLDAELGLMRPIAELARRR